MCATADLKVNTACHCRKALLDGDQLVQVAIVVDVLASLERLLVKLLPSTLCSLLRFRLLNRDLFLFFEGSFADRLGYSPMAPAAARSRCR